VEARLLERFRRRLVDQLKSLDPQDILDAGCGEGHVSAWVHEALPGCEITGLEARREALAAYRARNPHAPAVQADLTATPFEDRTFDVVLCTEVLEHLPAPGRALAELARVSAGHLVLTVPHEPFFRAGNFGRGRYLRRLGSTPGHLNTWGRRSFLNLVETEADPLKWFSAFPWQGVVARRRT
jgi:2-polyprenyl-3-methyl-5-hydroxy-6-metoxy-1,4-benzoquinol methylase